MRKVAYLTTPDVETEGWYTLTEGGAPDQGPFDSQEEAEDALEPDEGAPDAPRM